MKMIKKVIQEIERIESELRDLNEAIYAEPELGGEEYKACQVHIQFLQKHGFQVETQYQGIPTAFKAILESVNPGPTIAYLAEYDALPDIGHGCGHNLLGTVSSGAGVVLGKMLPEVGGRVIVFGTPAEETNGFKVDMAEKGAFDDIAVAMIAHPGANHCRSGRSLAMDAVEFTFLGKAAHAAEKPEAGINALDAAINTFNNINALREHMRSDARVHGYIKEGGIAANIVPERAVARFYVRALTKSYLKQLVEKVKNCAEGASLAAGTQLRIKNYEKSYDNMVTNSTLSEAYCRNLIKMGVKTIENCPDDEIGSIDAGNVSHKCPTIHPYFAVSETSIRKHTREFAKATVTHFAYGEMKKTIGALVLTGLEVVKDSDFLKALKAEFCVTGK
jgi:amidohydrolase